MSLKNIPAVRGNGRAKKIQLGISPCPNDTFVFDAWVNGKLAEPAPPVNCRLEDISRLNALAFSGALDVAKVSFFAYGLLRNRYVLLGAGGALGRGCGPLIVAGSAGVTRQDLASKDAVVAVPGRWTTANLLLSLYQPDVCSRAVMRFEDIMPAVARGDVTAGVVIHEGRFTFERHGLRLVEDLGLWWEVTTGCPIPLGGIIAKKELGPETIAAAEGAVRRSLLHALDDPDEPLDFMRAHAREMDEEVMRGHVALYVNEYSLDYGSDGRKAIETLMRCAEGKGLFDNQPVLKQ